MHLKMKMECQNVQYKLKILREIGKLVCIFCRNYNDKSNSNPFKLGVII